MLIGPWRLKLNILALNQTYETELQTKKELEPKKSV